MDAGKAPQQLLGIPVVTGEFVYTKALGMHQLSGQQTHVHPLSEECRGPQEFAQQLQPRLGRKVLLHVLHKPVAFGVAGDLAVDQKTPLDVSVSADEFLKLFQGERSGQVGDAEQSICWLQLDD